MMKKYFILFALLVFALSFAGCGGGSGSMDSPKGENPGKATLVELTPSHFVSHTNSDITLHAKVLDGNGNPVNDKMVVFTNLSPIGALNKFTDRTDANGIATVTLHSHVVGFATIQAEVNEGLNQVRDRTIVYYSDFALMWPEPRIVVEVDADGDGIYNETSDFNFFETSTDDTALLRATAYDEFGKRMVGIDITFSGDSGSSFPLGNVYKTNSNGEAFAYLKVSPTSVVGQETSLNLYATGYIGGLSSTVGFLQIFLQPVYITGITLVANPTGVVGSAGETSTVTAYVTTSAGVIPDDLAVQFSVSPVTAGYVTPLIALTENGAASTVFTPSATYLGNATITATIGTATNTVIILVATELVVEPSSQTIDGTAGGTTPPYTISGGIPPYTVTTDTPGLPPIPATVAASGDTFTVTVPAATAATTSTYTVTDSAGHTAEATLEVTAAPIIALTVNPLSQSLGCSSTGFHFTVSGGTPPYIINSLSPAVATVTPDATGFTAIPVGCGAVPPAPSSTPVNITVQDSAAVPALITVVLTVTNP